MHRSITLSEIVSTFSNDVDQRNSKQDKENFIAKIGIGLVEFLISSLFLSYGVIFAENVDDGKYSVEKGLWTMVLYSSARHIAAPFSKCITEYLQDKQIDGFRYIISASACLLFTGLILPGHIVYYGIFGGISSNLISSQLKFFVTKKRRSDEKSFEGNIQSARAISLLILPHLMLFLVENYALDDIQLIFAAFLLNIIPAALILRPEKHSDDASYPEMSRYHTLPALSRQTSEMVEFSNPTNLLQVSNPVSGFIETNDGVNKDNEESDSLISLKDEILNSTLEVVTPEETNLALVPLTAHTVQMYYSSVGVSILPEIPEEPEEESRDRKDVIDLKRLSRISTKLEEINQKENHETVKEILDMNELLRKVELPREKIQNIEYIPNYQDNQNKFLRDLTMIRKRTCCSPLSSYVWRQRLRNLKYFCLDYFLNPLTNSLTEPFFYPILVSKVILTLTSTIFITLAPYLALRKNEDYKREDTTFLLSYMAFAWCLFLMFLPLVVTFKNGKVRATFILGLSLAGCSMLRKLSRQTSEMVEFSNPTNLLQVSNPVSGFIETNDGVNKDNEESDSLISLKDEILNSTLEVVTPEETNLALVPLTAHTVQMYYSSVGVSILPEIPEEPEEESRDRKDVIDLKRLSRISTKLEEINQKENHETVKEILDMNELLRKVELPREKIQNIEYIPNYQDNQNKFLRDLTMIRKRTCCSPLSSYVWRQRLRNLKYFCLDYFLNPLTNSLTEPFFYPILVSKVILTLTSTIFITLAPYLALRKNEDYKREDTTFLLSYMAFAWCLFLMFLPLVVTFKNGKVRATFILGLSLAGCSMLLVTKQRLTNDFMTWCCLLYGCGYGMMSYTENFVYKSFLNGRRMKLIKNPLEIFSGLFVILVYSFIYHYQLDVPSMLPLASFVSYLTVAVIWIMVPQIKVVVIVLRKYYEKRDIDESFL